MENLRRNHPSRLLISILAALGLWTFESKWQFIYRIYGVTLHILFSVLFTVAMFINLASIESLDSITEALYMSLTEASMLVKVFIILIKGKTVICVVKSLVDEKFTLQNDKEIHEFKKHYEQFNKIRSFYLFVCLTCIFSGFVLPLFTNERKFPFPAWFPFDWRKSSRWYWFLYGYEVTAMTINCLSNATLDLFQSYLMFQMGMSFKLLGLRLKILGELREDFKVEEKFKENIKMHQEILRIMAKVQNIISIPVFVQFNLSSIVICFSLFQLKSISPLQDTAAFSMFSFYIMAMVVQILLYCYYGNYLTEQSSFLIDSIYNANWVDQPLKFKKTVFTYMESVKQPNRIKVFGLFMISLDIFTMIINSSYRLFAVLLNIDK